MKYLKYLKYLKYSSQPHGSKFEVRVICTLFHLSENLSKLFQAGLFLNMCICGTLFRDLEVTKRQRQPKQLRRSISNASSSAAVNAGMPEVEELRSLLEKGDISVLFSQEELNDCPRLSSSLVHLPTYITSEEV